MDGPAYRAPVHTVADVLARQVPWMSETEGGGAAAIAQQLALGALSAAVPRGHSRCAGRPEI